MHLIYVDAMAAAATLSSAQAKGPCQAVKVFYNRRFAYIALG